jgi:hypothetical protein
MAAGDYALVVGQDVMREGIGKQNRREHKICSPEFRGSRGR